MSLEKLEKIVKIVLRDLLAEDEKRRQKKGSLYDPRTKQLRFIPQMEARVKNLMNLAIKILPDHEHLFRITYERIDAKYSQLETSDAISVLRHLLEIIQIEKMGEEKIQAMKIFESAGEKMKQANLSFGKEDYSSVFHNLNTALELILKDKCGIPTTIKNINTSNVIDLLVKYKVEPYAHFSESRKRVTDVANRVKHQAYVPSKKEAIFGIKAMEDLISRLKDKEIELTEEIKDKIFQGL